MTGSGSSKPLHIANISLVLQQVGTQTVKELYNHLTLELNPSAQRCLPRLFIFLKNSIATSL
jgi:hypothetical protein